MQRCGSVRMFVGPAQEDGEADPEVAEGESAETQADEEDQGER
jgi:hypothetical protein